MRLFIAEKPSLGREISKYLPAQNKVQKRDGYIVVGDDVVTWAFGHVLQQAEPGDYDERYVRWNAADLPIVPKEWKLLITKSSEKQFNLIKDLISKADTIVNAGDPDREGQLLIDEILIYLNNEKPVERILLNALDEKSVRAALGDLRDNNNFYNLQQSALARARADWLIGMNLSRAYTLAARRDGNQKVVFPVGRVKTPTLALVVRRERELENFVPLDYFTLKVLYKHAQGSFWATWQPKEEQAGLDPDGRLLKKEIAEELAKKLQQDDSAVISKREKSKKKEPQRLPLSLSALQVLAGKAFGYDPQTVLDTAQKLYERKLTTYPRSDCDYLPQNQYTDRQSILRNLASCGSDLISDWAKGADSSIKSRAWNDKKITAHHAIIPTTVACKLPTLNPTERNIYQLIAQAYIAQFYPEHVYEQTKLTVQQLGELFVAHGRVVIELGWKSLYQKRKDTTKDKVSDADEDDNEDSNTNDKDASANKEAIETGDLPLVKKGDSLEVDNLAIDKKATKPPSRFTAATLLQAMKEIHKYVKNEELKKQLKDVAGIGTEATRATIIDELIKRKFLKEVGKKKVLQPTSLAYTLVDALPDEMLYPDETAVWEERLALMSEGKDKLDSFLQDQIAFLERLIQKAATVHSGSGEKLRGCPKCGKGTLTKRKGKFGEFYGCTNYPTCKYTEPVGGTKSTHTAVTKNRGSYTGNFGYSNFAEQNFNEPEVKLEPIKVPKEEQLYECPRCHKGYFVKPSENSHTWICSNRGECKTSCADVDGKPSVYANRD